MPLRPGFFASGSAGGGVGGGSGAGGGTGGAAFFGLVGFGAAFFFTFADFVVGLLALAFEAALVADFDDALTVREADFFVTLAFFATFFLLAGALLTAFFRVAFFAPALPDFDVPDARAVFREFAVRFGKRRPH